MAKIQFGAIVTGARGHVGGIVFSGNGSGSYITTRRTPSNPRTALQQDQRHFISRRASNWRSLSDAQRDDWDLYAADAAQEKFNSLGQSYFASGFAWYVAINTQLQNLGRAVRADAPTTGTPAMPTLSSASITEADPDAGTITYPSNEWATFDMVVNIWFANGAGVGVANAARFRNVLRKQATVGATSETLTGIIAAFGNVQAGQKYFIEAFRQSDQGRRSAPATITGLVT